MALPTPLVLGAAAGLMFAAQSVKDKPQPVAHFRKLHEQNIEAFQHRLTVIAQSLESKDIDLRNDSSHDELHDLLHRYTEAIADLERMNVRLACSMPRFRTKKDDAEATEAKSSHFELVSMLCPTVPDTAARRFRAASFGLTMNAFFQIVVASTVGIALLVPMIIMVLHSTRNASLITTCVFVPSFALGLVILNHLVFFAGAWLQRIGIKSEMLFESTLQTKDIIGATAAYAAVLVVFVGVSIPHP